MTNFKIGDKVRRISGKSFPELNMTHGSIYTVMGFGIPNNSLILEGMSGWSWLADHFELVDEKQEYPNPPHIHRDAIIAWANGAEIEYSSKILDYWAETDNPLWDVGLRYRIKPNKSSKNVEIERIQEELDKLSKRLEELKGEDK